MTPSISGMILLLLVGLGFAVSGVVAIRHAPRRGHGRLRAVFDLLIATVAFADAALTLVGDPARVLLWVLASLCLGAAAVVAVRGVATAE